MDDPQPPRSSSRALVVAIVLWLVACALGTLSDLSDGAAFALGSFVGRAAVTAALAALGRFLYVRFGARDRRVLSPWLFGIAGAIALVAAVAGAAGRTADRRDAEQACSDPPSAERVFARPIGRLRFGPANPAVAKAFTQDAPAEVRDRTDSVAARTLFEGSQQVGGAVVIVANSRVEFDGVVRGLRKSVPDARELRVSGRRAATGHTQGFTALVVLRDQCTILETVGVDQEDATIFAKGLLR